MLGLATCLYSPHTRNAHTWASAFDGPISHWIPVSPRQIFRPHAGRSTRVESVPCLLRQLTRGSYVPMLGLATCPYSHFLLLLPRISSFLRVSADWQLSSTRWSTPAPQTVVQARDRRPSVKETVLPSSNSSPHALFSEHNAQCVRSG